MKTKKRAQKPMVSDYTVTTDEKPNRKTILVRVTAGELEGSEARIIATKPRSAYFFGRKKSAV